MKTMMYVLFSFLLLFGFSLAEDQQEAMEEPVIIQNPELGQWRYETSELSIHIERRQDDTPRTWFEVDVRASPEQPLQTYITEGKRPGRTLVNPQKLAKENQLVLAITDDYSGARIQQDQKVGIVIREGIVLGTQTRSSRDQRGWPNLDTLAVFDDGGMKACVCDEFTAQEYLDMGATNVFAFGPVLVSEGKTTAYVMDEDYYPYNEPRMAIGMVEPYHYIIVAAVGRDESSVGVTPAWLAQKMLDLGCTEALNLDGGGTAALMFMGEVLNRSTKNMRSVNSLIGFGQNELVSLE